MKSSFQIKTNGETNFDFLHGTWQIQNKVLNGRLTGATTWTQFPAKFYGFSKFLKGSMNVDNFEAYRDGKPFHACSIRIFDKKTNEWIIYWIDSNGLEILPQVKGKFENGRGIFYGEDIYQNKPTKLRFIWKDITSHSATWEQAYYDSENENWETNWIMSFSKIGEESNDLDVLQYSQENRNANTLNPLL